MWIVAKGAIIKRKHMDCRHYARELKLTADNQSEMRLLSRIADYLQAFDERELYLIVNDMQRRARRHLPDTANGRFISDLPEVNDGVPV